MTDDELALLRAIRANPDDDLPRLVMADWLDERGEHARAEFIRLQVAEAATGLTRVQVVGDRTEPDTDAAREFLRCYRAIWAFDRAAVWGWLSHLMDAGMCAGERASVFECDRHPASYFRRGFVGAVTCPAAAWLSHGDAVLERHPVARVTLTTDPAIYWTPRPGHLRVTVSGTAGVAGWDVPNPPPETDPRDVRSIRTAALAARWPGVSFALPPEPRGQVPYTLDARRLTTGMAVPAELLRDSQLPDTLFGHPVIVGDPTVPPPQGVFDVAEATARRAARTGHSRRAAIPAARTRFPRPR